MRNFQILVVILVLGGALFWALVTKPAAAPAEAPPSVLVSTIKLSSVSVPATLTAYGSIAAGPGGEVTLAAQASFIPTGIAVVPGQRVTSGEVLMRIAPDPQSVAEAQKAASALTAAQANRARIAALLASHLATSADLATADQALRDAASALKAVQATGAGLPRALIAPFPGVISAVLAAPGAVQPAGTPLLRLIGSGNLVAVIGIPPAELSALAAGDTAQLILLDTNAKLSAKVSQIGALADPQTGLAAITLALAGDAMPGEPVQAVITTGLLTGYAVPRDAVQNDAQGDYGFQIGANNIAHRVTVHILGVSGGQTILAPDLDTRQAFVTTGAYQLDDGMAVRSGAAP